MSGFVRFLGRSELLPPGLATNEVGEHPTPDDEVLGPLPVLDRSSCVPAMQTTAALPHVLGSPARWFLAVGLVRDRAIHSGPRSGIARAVGSLLREGAEPMRGAGRSVVSMGFPVLEVLHGIMLLGSRYRRLEGSPPAPRRRAARGLTQGEL